MKCELPGCNKTARRRFCSNRHKDKFHNRTNPRGKFAHMHPDRLDDAAEREDPEHGMSWDGHGY